ncbi:hypothetical protein OJ996_13545 [Luteolibacter sp. GHJ8]|uniref:Sialate O-acetylesterase domain-containing protein n=1 Tax=Luteolibacter rhizosphaerae TaxID=2989719 RepID=A0ABT3G439_9BACT|nr:sialate O-acetylesterase [Luteolibacter rhizosphaerae]MCW1914606.1 hypothetical protein [Luteolibacter rhizosphaerae]
MKLILRSTLVAAATISLSSAADPFLSPLFTDHMVLQRDQQDSVWGWTQPGAKITVTLAGKSADAVAGADGKWKVTLPALPAGGPHTMTVSGPQSVTLNDILIGDVWICSGQSNMEWNVANSGNAAEEIAAGTHPQVRSINLDHVTSATPQKTFSGSAWMQCTPQTVGSFTAVGYYFGRKLNQDLGVPIGLIHTSWGGTIAEAWASKESLLPLQDFNAAMEALEAQSRPSTGETPQQAWLKRHDAGTIGNWANLSEVDASWSKAPQPLQWSGSAFADLANLDGVAWFRRTVEVPAADAGKEAELNLGAIDDDDTAWVNGREVGNTAGFAKQRSYKIPAGVLKAGSNAISVRIIDHSGNAGFNSGPESMNLSVPGSAALPLAGEWHYKVSADLTKTGAYPRLPNDNPNVPTVLYNAMIAPLLPYGVKGAIWYQGESNASRAMQYRRVLPAMIGDWRKAFGQGDFPFYIVQLANFTQTQPQPGEAEWAELREAQTLTSKNVKNAGLAVTIDIGEAGDIHPRNKQDVGKRLALQALAKTYGQKIVAAGPEFKSSKVEGSSIKLSFDSTGTGLVAKGGPLKGFAIAGADKKFVWADAKIDGINVVVSSAQVPAPVAVRYAWAANPEANLFNQEGLPAGPFRTDEWPGVTDARR